jgi:hypothetical protein
VKRKLRSWLVPTFVAPTLSTIVLVTLRELGGSSGVFGILRWLGLLAIASVASLLLSMCLLGVDWLLLFFLRRLPPTGRRGWLSGALAPLPAYGFWLLLRPPLLSAPSTHALAVAGALLLAAVAVRLMTNLRLDGRRLRFS